MRISLLILVLFIQVYAADGNNMLNGNDKARLYEAFKIEKEYGDKIWDKWSDVPFAVLLVTDSTEFLIRHPKPSADFTLLGYDSLLESNIYCRKRIFSTNLEATFPAVNGIPTVVIGQPQNTGKSSVAWIITLIHEHFHQLQNYQKDYYSSVNALNLSDKDKTGMWMLNYPFPYNSDKVNSEFDLLKKSLSRAIESTDTVEAGKLAMEYLQRKNDFKNSISADDYKYFSFQLWQEGIARYTELKITRLLLDNKYEFSKSIRELNDFTGLNDFYKMYLNDVINQINSNRLDNSKRICFYAIGAGEGLLLDLLNPDWKSMYFSNKFYLENYYPVKK